MKSLLKSSVKLSESVSQVAKAQSKGVLILVNYDRVPWAVAQAEGLDIHPQSSLLSLLCQRGLAEDFRLIYNSFGDSEKIMCKLFCDEMLCLKNHSSLLQQMTYFCSLGHHCIEESSLRWHKSNLLLTMCKI